MLCFCFYMSNAQIAVTNFPPYDSEENLVVDVLLGNGIVASNFASIGFANGIGYFDGFNANIGFDEGVILSTGGLDFVTAGFGAGSGISGDSDLELALNAINLTWPVNNVTVLEFDFVAESESMAFNYVFGSMEYTSYTCSVFNDIFGFFLSGPGIAGPYSNNAVNLAYIPDPDNPGTYTTTPVAVNTVNSGVPSGFNSSADCDNIDPNWADYNIYWVDNQYDPILNDWQGVNEPPEPELTVAGVTGFTTPLTAEYDGLVCGETYHIKLAIADASDGALNSVVFLEANSFSSPEVQISTVPNADLGLVLDTDNGVLEGCGTAALQFDRSGDMTMDLTITLEYSGQAEYGVDYNALPTEMILPAFQDQVIIPIDVFFDDISEGQETLVVTVSGVPVACEEVTVQDIELIIFDQEDLLVDAPSQIDVSCLGTASIEVFVDGGYAPYSYNFYDELGNVLESGELLEPGNLTFIQSPEETTSYSLFVTDDCSDQQFEDEVNIVVNQDELAVGLDEDLLMCQEDLGDITLNPVVNGTPPYNYTWFYDGVVISNEETLSNLPGDGLYQLVVEDVCGVIAGDEQMISFIELAPYVEIISYDVLSPEILPEGCFESILKFNMQEISDQDVSVTFDVGGTADFGIDYIVPSTSITIPAGEESFLLPISILSDNIEEGVESIEFNFPFIDACSDFPTQIIVQVYEPPPLTVELDEELIICEQDVSSGTLEGFFNGGIGLVNYGWYYNDAMISTDLDIETNDLEPGVYSFMAIDQCGNMSESSINFDIITFTPTVTLSSSYYTDPALLSEGCGSSMLTFELPVASTEDQVFYYSLEPSSPTFFNGYDIELLPGYVEFPAGVTSVDVDIVPLLDDLEEQTELLSFDFLFSNTCIPQNNIDLELVNYSPIEISVPGSQSLCVDQTLVLEADYIGGTPPYTVSWTYLNDTEDQDSITLEAAEGTFPALFTVVDDCGWSASAEVLVEGINIDDFFVAWPPNEVFACYGDNSEIVISLEGGLPPFNFEWFFNGQPVSDMLPIMPENEIYGPIYNQADNMLPNSTQLVPTSTPYTPYTYDYQVLITDSCNNELVYDIEVNIDDCILPTAFTPNGDGNNDVLWIDFGDLTDPVSLEVFNRWGTLVYRSQDYTPCSNFKSECWDGSHFQRYGDKCNTGTYYYVLTYSKPINNADYRDVSKFIDGIFGTPHERSRGRQRTGSVLLTR